MTAGAEDLLAWLGAARSRMRWQRAVRRTPWLLATLIVLWAGHLAAHRTPVAPAVLANIDAALLAFAAVAALGFAAWLGRRPTPERAAGSADHRAGLHDELLSALWFCRQGPADAAVARHVAAAGARTVQLSIPRLFPLRQSPAAWASVALGASVAAAAAWWPIAPAGSGEPQVRDVAPATAKAKDAPARSPAQDGETAERGHREDSLWSQVNRLATQVTDPGIAQSLADALAARDARAAARALMAARKMPAKDDAAAPIRAEDDGQMSDTLAQEILARLAEIQRNERGEAPQRAPSNEDRPTAQFDRAMTADREDAQQSAHREQSAAEEVLNTALRAVSRTSSGGRDSVHGEAESADGAGRAAVGGAMGRRIQSSTSGSGEGDSPDGVPTPVPEGESVLGEKTKRLEVALRAVEVKPESKDGDDSAPASSAAEEDFYTATRAQAATAAMGADTAASRRDVESAQRASSLGSAAYREAGKRYTLARHRRERDSAASARER